jgi:hypothetical protein
MTTSATLIDAVIRLRGANDRLQKHLDERPSRPPPPSLTPFQKATEISKRVTEKQGKK